MGHLLKKLAASLGRRGLLGTLLLAADFGFKGMTGIELASEPTHCFERYDVRVYEAS